MASTSSGASYVSRYDVFLSFRGKTRDKFTDHLYDKLVRAGVYPFRDNDCISRGEELKPEIQRGIKECRASIFVLSEFYANSRWCLDELDLILQQKKERNHFVLPLFYDVDHSDVKNHRGTFNINVKPNSKWTEDNVKRWKAALEKIGHMAGKVVSGPETHILKEIVDIIKQRLDLKQIYRQENLVGMETRDKEINFWLDEQSNCEIYSIWGMGGSGKTTLARHIMYSNWHKFESLSILEDIGSRCKSTNDLRQLQEKLIRDIIEGKEQTNLSGWQGTYTIENALQRKKSLILLDNIDSKTQLEALLGTGTKTPSKIIITTTERNSSKWFQSTSWRYQEQEMKLLDDSDSLMLLNLHALESNAQTEDYEELAHKLLAYCQGNPLAIKVLGSALKGYRKKEVWESRLRSLMEKDLHNEIQDVLRMSYDSLIPYTVKELFLHIACFFTGEDKDYVVKILESDYFALSGIVTLTNSGLLSVSPNNKLMMHRLLQEMGRTIVFDESPRLPGKRSRVWRDKESHEVLCKNHGSKKVEGLALDMKILTQEDKEIVQISDLDTSSFKKMTNLKLLQLNQLKLNGSYNDFPKDLRLLRWRQCHLTEIPSELDMGKLVAIDMSNSRLEVFEPPTVLPLLRILNLKDSHNLSEIKNLYQLPKLESLIIWNCQMLLRVCNTIEQLKHLALLNMSGCKDLCKGPRPCIWKAMSNSLKQLFLKDCILEQSEFLCFKTQPLLEYLNMVNSRFENLPNYNYLQKLQVLDLSGCRKLRMLLCLPSKLAELYISDCDSLERITFESHEYNLNKFRYKGCVNLSEVEDFFKLVPVSKLSETDLGHMKWLREYQDREVCLVGDGEVTEGRSLCLQMLCEFNIMSISLPDVEMPDMIPEYEYTSEYENLSFYVPLCPENRRLKGLNVTFKYSISGDEWVWFAKVSLNNAVELIYNAKVFGNPASGEVGIWLSYWEIGKSLHVGHKVDVSIVDTKGLRIHGCGASLVYTDEEEEDESFEDSLDLVVDNNDSFEYNRESFEDARESFEDNNEGADILGVDISRFKISTGTYYLCRRDYCQLMEVGRLTHDWFKILVGDKIDCTEVGGWRNTGRPEQLSQSFTKPKSASKSRSAISLLTMATTSVPHRWKYDVFVSFRGDDIRKNFMDHMFSDFKRKGIRAFRDDRQLPKGEAISPHLYKAIEESRFLIVVFSKNYASSSWCLRELVKILECKQTQNPKHEVGIIFYDVKPDVVRHQTDTYAEAIDKHQRSNRPEVDNWKKALFMAANLSGWDLHDMTDGYEYKFIDCISKYILKILCDGPFHVGENLVGIDSHLETLNLSRFTGSDKVNMIGICGISGIGKTTLAKAIYKLMYVHFEESCFCEDVKEVTKRQGLIQVQLHMIAKIMKTEDVKISGVGEGIMVIKQRMACKPILLVLDDVDHRDQLEALAGSASWFCPGSLIIFTGKDKQLLRSHRVDEIHDMQFLDEDQSLQLFSFYAFEEKHPSTGFRGLAYKAVKYVRGHPLALKVLGCFLYGKTVGEWVSELDRLKLHPNEEIQRVLHLSYDGLNLQQQNILLNIACLFIGVEYEFAASILDGCNFFADTNMKVLVDKSLITISSNMSLQMHDLIQAMAKDIVREESIMPGKQRRLLISSNVYDISGQNKVAITEAVEVLVLLLEKFSQKVHIDANDFAHMKKLRILKIYQEEERFEQKLELKGHNVIFSGNLYYLSNELRLFYWHGCPFKYLPSDFYPENIVAINLSYSKIKHFWTTPKCFNRLKVMKLRYCCNLTTTPDFSEITNLEVLDLEGCVNLVSVHPSIGMIKRLVVLKLTGCLKVDQLPEALGRIKSLTELHVDRTAITELPTFVSSLINLESLSFGGQGRIQPRWWTSITAPFGLLSKQQHPPRSVSLAGLHMLKSLNFSNCNLVQVPDGLGGLSCLKELNLEGNNLLEVPESIGGLSCLRELYLSGNNFTSLPGSLSQLSHLGQLNVDGCKKLEVLPELPPNLFSVSASDCTSLREVLGSSKDQFSNRHGFFYNCPKLFKNVTIDSRGSISKTECLDSSITSQGFNHQLSAFLGLSGFKTNRREFFLQDSGYSELDIIYHGNSMPEWFTNRSMENHVKVELPSDWCSDKFRGYGTCVVFKCKKPFSKSVKNFDGTSMKENYFPRVFEKFLKREVIGTQDSYMIWLHYTRGRRGWEEAKNFVTFEENNEDVEVKECGVRLICDEDTEQEAHLSMLQGLPTPTQHGGALHLDNGPFGTSWSW